MSYKLPPLNTLRLFEAAGRMLSFKLAAEELQVTPSAVSHGIHSLETWLGVPLFVRTSRGLALSDAGLDYLPAVREALAVLAGASDAVPGRPPRQKISMSVAPTFGARLILPKLSSFTDANPEITLHIDTSHQQVQFPHGNADVAIRMGSGRWPGLSAVLLTKEELVPICSPKFLEKMGSNRDLSATPLIHVTLASQDWQAWAAGAGCELATGGRALLVDSIQMAWDAAAEGLGVAMGRLPLAWQDLSSGRLVRFCGPSVVADTGYWLVGPPEVMERKEIVAFRDWLLGEMAVIAGR